MVLFFSILFCSILFYVIADLFYGAETWPLNNTLAASLDGCHIRAIKSNQVIPIKIYVEQKKKKKDKCCLPWRALQSAQLRPPMFLDRKATDEGSLSLGWTDVQ